MYFVKCLVVFCPFFFFLLPIFLLSCMSFLIVCGIPFYILGASPLPDIYIVNIFFYSVICSFTLYLFFEKWVFI